MLASCEGLQKNLYLHTFSCHLCAASSAYYLLSFWILWQKVVHSGWVVNFHQQLNWHWRVSSCLSQLILFRCHPILAEPLN